MKDKLNEYLFSVGNNAENKFDFLMKQLIENDETITEQLKETNQLLWIQKINSCKNIAEKIILKEDIYGDNDD